LRAVLAKASRAPSAENSGVAFWLRLPSLSSCELRLARSNRYSCQNSEPPMSLP